MSAVKKLVVVLFLLLPNFAFAAVDYDTANTENNNSGTNTGITGNAMTLSASATLLLCTVYSTVSLSSLGITFNSVSMTSLSDNNGYGTFHLYVFGLLNPTTGSSLQPIASWASVSGTKSIHCASYTGTDTTTLPATIQKSQSSGTPGTSFTATITTDAIANSWVAMYARNESGTFTAGTGTTIRSQVAGDALMWADSNGIVAASSGYSMSASWTGSANWMATQLEISPPPASPSSTFFDFSWFLMLFE